MHWLIYLDVVCLVIDLILFMESPTFPLTNINFKGPWTSLRKPPQNPLLRRSPKIPKYLALFFGVEGVGVGKGQGEEGQEEGGGVGVGQQGQQGQEGGHFGLGYYMDYDITIIILKVLQFLWFWGGGLFKSG